MNRYLPKFTRSPEGADQTDPVATTPEGHVALHTQCKRCRTLVRRWTKAESLWPRSKPDKKTHRDPYGTVAQLEDASSSCHLCSLILETYRVNWDWQDNPTDRMLFAYTRLRNMGTVWHREVAVLQKRPGDLSEVWDRTDLDGTVVLYPCKPNVTLNYIERQLNQAQIRYQILLTQP
jgi:hypothetical protein